MCSKMTKTRAVIGVLIAVQGGLATTRGGSQGYSGVGPARFPRPVRGAALSGTGFWQQLVPHI
jgi:hypothetical protein